MAIIAIGTKSPRFNDSTTVSRGMKLDMKYIWYLLGVLVVSSLVYFFWLPIRDTITQIVQLEWLNFGIIVLTAAVTVLHKIKFRKIAFKANMSFSDFKIPFEELFSFVSNPITVVCSFSLARGLFLQCTGQKTYFPLLSNTELIFIAIVIGYLLFLSLSEFVRNLVELITVQPQMVMPKATDKDGHPKAS